MSMLNSIGQRGSKVAISLYALELGAGAAAVGALAALFAVFPLLLAVQVGRISDRFGMRAPIVGGAATMAAGLAVAFNTSEIAWLFLCPALIGLGHIFFHVSIHNLIGSHGAGETRTRNFATFSLGASIAAFLGPSTAGVSIGASRRYSGSPAASSALVPVETSPAYSTAATVATNVNGTVITSSPGVTPASMRRWTRWRRRCGPTWTPPPSRSICAASPCRSPR